MRTTKMAAGLAVAGLVFAGCGENEASGDGGSGDGSGDVQTISISEGKGGGTELFDAMMAAYQEAGSYHFEMDMDAMGMQVTAEGAADVGGDSSAPNMTMTMQLPDMGEMSMRLVDGQFYMSMPPEAGLPTDTPWLTIDPEGDGPMAQSLGPLVDEMGSTAEMQADFAENAELISVEEGGSDTIDGVEVTEYLLTVDSEDAATFMESTGQATAGDVPSGELTFSLWIDGDALPRKMTADFGEVGSMEMRFSEFGEPVEVEAPPEDEVTDFSSLTGGQ